MGVMTKLIGLGDVAREVREISRVFKADESAKQMQGHEAYLAALGQFGQEFAHPSAGWFDQLVDGLNRLPRPTLALGTIGLFIYAMIDPGSFSERMSGLAYVPEPLWWLFGAVVSFYFGARELHHLRVARRPGGFAPVAGVSKPTAKRMTDIAENPAQNQAKRPAPGIAKWVGEPVNISKPTVGKAARIDKSSLPDPGDNAALRDWRASLG